MDITNYCSKKKLMEWAQKGIQIVEARGDKRASNEIQQAISQLEQGRYLLTVLGKSKRGKSTLINALLGRLDDLVAPIDKLPASNVISRFSYAPVENVVVTFQNGSQIQIKFESIREYVTEENNPENSKKVAFVDIVGPFENLVHDLVLADTPGVASIHTEHDAILQEFIPQSDAVIFLVTARMPLDDDELALLRRIQNLHIHKIFFAINKIDATNAEDLQNAITYNKQLLQKNSIFLDKIYLISAKQCQHGDYQKGFTELIDDIRNYMVTNKGKEIEIRFISRIAQFIEPCSQAIQIELANTQKNEATLASELENLEETKELLEHKATLIEKEFLIYWERAVDELASYLYTIERETLAIAQTKIAETFSSLKDSKQLQIISQLITQIVENQLAPLTNCMEQKLKTAYTKLDAQYPNLMVSSAGSISLQTKANLSQQMAPVGGAAVALGGMSLICAGATTVASIANANAVALTTSATLTSTVVTPTLITTLGRFLPTPIANFLSHIAGITTTTSATAPVVLTTIPFWVAISAPLGWSLVGLGLLSIPLLWRFNHAKNREELQKFCCEQIIAIFEHLKNERLPEIKNIGQSIAMEFRVHTEHKLCEISLAMNNAKKKKLDTAHIQKLQNLMQKLELFLGQVPYHHSISPLLIESNLSNNRE